LFEKPASHVTRAASNDGTSSSGSVETSMEESNSSTSSSTGQASTSSGISRFVEKPLLLASTLSHVNKEYIKMRRRRKWWRKLGGFPKVG
jgi:hypothetical protein